MTTPQKDSIGREWDAIRYRANPDGSPRKDSRGWFIPAGLGHGSARGPVLRFSVALAIGTGSEEVKATFAEFSDARAYAMGQRRTLGAVARSIVYDGHPGRGGVPLERFPAGGAETS